MSVAMEEKTELEIKDAGKEVFLVRLPPDVLREWESGRDGDLLGVFTSASGVGQRYAFSPVTKGKVSSEPEFDFMFDKNVRNTFVLTRTQGGSAGISKVTNKGRMRQRMNKAAKARLAASTKKAGTPITTITQLEDACIPRDDYDTSAAVIRLGNTNAPPRPVGYVRSVAKREKLPREELVSIISQMFMKKPAWTMREMEQGTEQPTAYLKEILTEMCEYLKAGPFKNHYHLKAEYLLEGAPRLELD